MHSGVPMGRQDTRPTSAASTVGYTTRAKVVAMVLAAMPCEVGDSLDVASCAGDESLRAGGSEIGVHQDLGRASWPAMGHSGFRLTDLEQSPSAAEPCSWEFASPQAALAAADAILEQYAEAYRNLADR